MKFLPRAALFARAIRRLRDTRDVLFSVAGRDGRLIVTDYPYCPHSRTIEEAASGRRLGARLQTENDCYVDLLRRVARHTEALLRIPRDEETPIDPFWANGWFPPFDGASLYGLIAEHAPQRYIEVGSGMSTRFARKAITDLNLKTRIVSIDPHPYTAIDAICDQTLRIRMEDVPRKFWEGIAPEDLLFVDNSHRSFSNSDVTVFFSEVLPCLSKGTIWGLHDILLPWDYPEEWRDRFYNEQYLLLAYLLGGGDGDEILLPVKWASSQSQLHDILMPLWEREHLFRGIGTHGACFWMRRGTASASAKV